MRRLSAADPRLLSAVWPACVGALAVLYANVESGAWTRRSAIAWMMASWGARLTVQALYTRASAPAFEFPLQPFLLTSYSRLLAFSLFFSLPAAIASRNPDPSLSPVEIAASAFWAIAFAAETTADRQRLRFLSNPANAGLSCRSGLWRLVPQAHAVCEAAIWTALAMFAFASPWGWIALVCPALILYSHLTSRRTTAGA